MIDIGFDLKRITGDYYREVDGATVEITEKQESGAAKLNICFQVTGNRQFIQLLQENDAWLTYIDNKKCADGIIIELDSRDRKRCRLYIIELTKTLTDSKWAGKVKKQFRGATLRVLSFLSSLGIKEVETIEYFTGYLDSSIEQQITDYRRRQKVDPSSPIARKGFVGGSGVQFNTEALEWEQRDIKVFEGVFQHHKVRLILNEQDIGVGEFIISNGTFN